MKSRDVPKFGPLQGVNVLLSGNAIAGPAMCGIFAEMGAIVTSLERVDMPDVLRMAVTEWFSVEHRNQLSIAANIQTPEGKKILAKLLKANDIFVENNKAGTMASMGVTDEWIWSHNPKIVIVQVSGFGQSGDPAYTRRAALDGIAQAFSGYINNNGLPSTPICARPYTADYVSSLFGAIGALAALHRAQQTGVGESIDVAMYETLLRLSADGLAYGLNRNIPVTRPGNRTPRAWGEGVYKCKDGKFVFWMSGNAGKPFMGTLKTVGMQDYDPGPKEDPPFSHNPEYGEELERRMKAYCDEHTAQEVAYTASRNGATCSKIMEFDDMLSNSHYQARNSITEWYDPCLGETMKGTRPTPVFKNNPTQIWRGTPILGMDNEDILEELGYTPEEIEKLYEKKIIRYGSLITKTFKDGQEQLIETKDGKQPLKR